MNKEDFYIIEAGNAETCARKVDGIVMDAYRRLCVGM
jgi:hypothetical protein